MLVQMVALLVVQDQMVEAVVEVVLPLGVEVVELLLYLLEVLLLWQVLEEEDLLPWVEVDLFSLVLSSGEGLILVVLVELISVEQVALAELMEALEANYLLMVVVQVPVVVEVVAVLLVLEEVVEPFPLALLRF